jgi:hypothetical protein
MPTPTNPNNDDHIRPVPGTQPAEPEGEEVQQESELVDTANSSAAANDESIAALYDAIDQIGEGRVNVHTGAQAALFNGQSTVLISMALGRTLQRVQRLTEWAGTSSEGAHCPVCGMHREATTRAQAGPNRGHLEHCPLRRNLDNLNRALGITNRGRSQGPGAVLVWAGRSRTAADQTPPEQYPSPLTPEGVVTALAAAGAESSPGVVTLSQENLAQLLRMWTLGHCDNARTRALAGPDAAISQATGQAHELPIVVAARALARAVMSSAVSGVFRERANAVMQALGEGGEGDAGVTSTQQ